MHRVALLLILLGPAYRAVAGDPDMRELASKALRRATAFFREHVATEGGYLWRYSEDLKRREGEGKASDTTIWVQPPGTPSVGMAFLSAYDATGDAYYLDAAKAAAMSLVRGQLRSGGWDYRIEFDASKRTGFSYRVDKETPKAKNVTTLDDNTTQAALRLLMRVDKALGFKDKAIHEAAHFALASLLKAQYPNGAWAQRFEGPPDAAKFPVKKANYPESWPREWPKANYMNYYTLNDNVLRDMVETLLLAETIYGEAAYRKAAIKVGDFLILAQMPEPQPAWAQQYDANMQPAWARKFEPPAVTGGESQGAMQTLMVIYQVTGDKKYLAPIPAAVKYLQSSQLSDKRLARFYELKTNKPLYFTTAYELTYKDDDLPTHYGFKVGHKLDQIAKEHARLSALPVDKLKYPRPAGKPTLSPAIEAKAKTAIAALDAKGRWVEDGKLKNHGADDPTRRIISCQTFVQNVDALSAYLRASKGK